MYIFLYCLLWVFIRDICIWRFIESEFERLKVFETSSWFYITSVSILWIPITGNLTRKPPLGILVTKNLQIYSKFHAATCKLQPYLTSKFFMMFSSSESDIPSLLLGFIMVEKSWSYDETYLQWFLNLN